MGNNIRASGIDVIGKIPWGTHFCQFYQTKGDLMEIVVPYFKAGLENNESCMWIISRLLEVEEAKEVLRKGIPDFEFYLEKGQIEIVSYFDFCIKDYISESDKFLKKWIKKLNPKVTSDYAGLRISGDTFWSEAARQNFVFYEEEVDRVISKHRMIALCTYSIDKCNIAGIAEIISNHLFILAKKEGRWEKIENLGRKKAEKAEIKLKEPFENLEKKVKERTDELEKAYNSLKESEKGLVEAQKIAHIGSWDWNVGTNESYWSDETYRILGYNPQGFKPTYDAFFRHVHPGDRAYVDNTFKHALNGRKDALNGRLFNIDFRIISADGVERIVNEKCKVVFDEENNSVRINGIVRDITERERAEEALAKLEKTRIKELHHRIKNNLQVISSLLGLQAEKFSDAKVLEAFKESQNRVISMALIHEELYKGGKIETLDFADYLRKLAADLFSSYNLRNDNVSLNVDLEHIYLDTDTAIPLGIIVNEMVSNSLKHAFSNRVKGEIGINLKKAENFAVNKESSGVENGCKEGNSFQYILRVADNGKGIPEEIDFRATDSLGFQLISLLVGQIDGCVELRRDQGTEFTIRFSKIQK